MTSRKTILVPGSGAIGSVAIPLIGRDPAVEGLMICDFDVVEPGNLAAQSFGTGDVGRKKAHAARDNVKSFRPELPVLAMTQEVEDLALACFGGVVIACLDSDGPRQVAAERTWMMGGTFIDCAVNGAAGLARITTVPPAGGRGCFECAWDEQYERLAVRNSCAKVPPTNAPAALATLAASHGALQLRRVLEEGPGTDTTEVVVSAGARHCSVIPRNPSCRFHHRALPVEMLTDATLDHTLGSLFDLLQAEAFSLPGFSFDRRVTCSKCGFSGETLRVNRQTLAGPCPDCGETLTGLAFLAATMLQRSAVSPGDLHHTLGEIGLSAGDVVVPAGSHHGMQIGDPFASEAQPSTTPVEIRS